MEAKKEHTQTAAVIPHIWGTSDKIREVLAQTSQHVDLVVAVNDGGTRHGEVPENCVVLSNEKTEGKGRAMRKGIWYALNEGVEAVVLLDGDGEHNPEDIPRFLEKLISSDLASGQRELHRSRLRSLLNFWANLWVRLIIPGIRDTQCGFKAVRADLIKKLRLSAQGFEIDMEILLEAAKASAHISHLDISADYRPASGVRLKDYLLLNNFFDMWVLRNWRTLKLSNLRKAVLLPAAFIGLILNSILLILLRWTPMRR